jgi:serine/threonine-protein kinase
VNIKTLDFTKLIGQDLGNVMIIKELGRGAMGAVFVAFQRTLKRQVAVKVLPKQIASTELAREQFRDEAEIIAGLSHPYIIPIYEMGETDEMYFQVMQLVNGTDLHKLIKDRLRHPVPHKRLMPRTQSLQIMANVLDGLGYAHDEGVVHQDIKPANIFVEKRAGRPLIGDFGIAKTAQMECRNEGMIVGTPAYLAPEQAAAADTDGRADIYSAGVILFEMLAGVLPMRRENARQLLIRKLRQPDTVYTKRPSQASPLIDQELEQVILKAIAGRPDQRYQNCYEFRDALVRLHGRYVHENSAVEGNE